MTEGLFYTDEVMSEIDSFRPEIILVTHVFPQAIIKYSVNALFSKYIFD